MKSVAISIALIISFCYLNAQEGTVMDNLSMVSKILNTEKKYSIYLPPDYETSHRSYPVLYLLHGSGGNHLEWIQRGNLKYITDKAIREGIARPLIIVMPDASADGPKTGYFNFPDGKWMYEDFFFKEFIPYIENTYRIRAEKRYRSIAGLSMGGNGTFYYAMHHPEMFSSACPLSAGYRHLNFEQARERLKMYSNEITEKQVQDFYEQYSSLRMIKALPDELVNAVRWYIDCGDDDLLVNEANNLVHIEMHKRGIPHEFRVRDGAHTWDYWRAALPEVLRFISHP